MRFLVADRGKQTPVDAPVGTSRFEHRTVAGQATLEMTNEIASADVVVFFSVAVVTIVHSGQHSGAIGRDDELIRACQQRIRTPFWERPGNLVFEVQVQSDAQVRIEVPLDVEVGTVSDRQLDLAHGDLGQEVSKLDVGIFCPG